MKKCFECGGKLVEDKDIVLHKGKTHTINVMKCVKCGETTSDFFELKRVRKEIMPTFFEKIKNILHLSHGDNETEVLNFSKGRVL